MADVRLEALSKSFDGEIRALQDVTLDIADGELVVLVGPSGCGKSTLLRLIAGFATPNAGSVHIGGRDVTGIRPRDRDVAMVFQNYALYPHMTVRRNLEFGLRRRRLPREEIRERASNAARTVGLEPLLDRYPDTLSGGQRQRVAIGRAIVRNPSVYLMDEPLSNLDAALRLTMRSEIARLHAALRVTTVYVTHDQTEAMTLGDRVCVLRDGVVQQVGTPRELYGRPANRFVAGFIGSPPMNFLPGRVLDGALVSGELSLPLGPRLRQMLGDRRTTTIGIRPADFRIGPAGSTADDGVRVPVVPELVEYLGAQQAVEFVPARGSGRLVALVEARASVPVGRRVDLWIDPGHVHLFDAEDGSSLATA